MSVSERYPGGHLRQAWPLAVSLAVHALLVLAWLHYGGHARIPDDTPQPLSVLLLPRSLEAPPPADPPKRKPAADKPSSQLPVPITTTVPQSLPASSDTTPPAPPAPVAAAPGPSAIAIVDAARQEIRKGQGTQGAAKGKPLQANGKWNRFENLVDAARVDDTPGPVTETYTSPDGEVLYRTRSGGKVTCRKSGSTGPPAPWRSEADIRAGAGSVATLGVANSAGSTLCPESERDWKRR